MAALTFLCFYSTVQNMKKTTPGPAYTLSDFDFNLPEHLVARYPKAHRRDSRLLCLSRKTGDVVHRQFPRLLDLLQPNDVLVMNDTRVIPARLFARKSTGGRVELLIERVLNAHHTLTHVRSSKPLKVGSELTVLGEEQSCVLKVIDRQDALFVLAWPSSKTVF